MENTKWVICPNCKSKTRLKLLPETVLEYFPLFCPKCKKEVVIDARKQEVCLIAMSLSYD